MRVEHQLIPAHDAEGEGGSFVVPGVRRWLIFCDDHGELGEFIFTVIEMLGSQWDRIIDDAEKAARFLTFQLDIAATDLSAHECDHRMPSALDLLKATLR